MTHFDFQEVREQKAEKNELQGVADFYREVTDSHFIWTKSNIELASDEILVKLPKRMRKSTSLKLALRGHCGGATTCNGEREGKQ
ncbi:Hypothetical predicted protein [Olea europaea subsp. europaea]|uniref:Uncharacterized protein n=1 Tax=Olea europaea subsp. europaea TaxID=158383 RepID=A0A8S0PQM2_OLEEU|nr:Hypothetical predicted protein [Olea europaea subsp. europaea]